MRILLWTTIVASCWLGSQADLEYCLANVGTSESGEGIGSVLQALNTDDEVRTLIFLSQYINADGLISFVELFASRPGTVYLMVFRRIGDDKYGFVGKNKINVQLPGYQTFEAGGSSRIRTRAGDYLGISYEEGTTECVVPVECASKTPTQGAPTPGSLMSSDLSAKDFIMGEEYTFFSVPEKRIAAIRVTITAIPKTLRLEEGKTPFEGFAAMMRDNVWGRICDLWYHPRGFPEVFCRNAGFPGALSAYAAQERGIKVKYSGPHHQMNIRCKLSQNVTILTCDKHQFRTCDKNRDMFIACKPNVRLVNGDGKHEGIPESFECGYWGTICDARDPRYHFDNPDKSWVTAFCKTLGYKRFTDIVRATDQDLRGIVKDDTWKNPDCDISVVSQLDECRSQPLAKRLCENKYYKITCGS